VKESCSQEHLLAGLEKAIGNTLIVILRKIGPYQIYEWHKEKHWNDDSAQANDPCGIKL
jgi:hypothetical protein